MGCRIHAEPTCLLWSRTWVTVRTQWQTQRSPLHTEAYTANSAEQLSQGLETMKGEQQWNNPHSHHACTWHLPDINPSQKSILSVYLYLPDATVTPSKVVDVPVSPTCNLGKQKREKKKVIIITAFVTLHLRTESSFLQNKYQKVITKEMEEFCLTKTQLNHLLSIT